MGVFGSSEFGSHEIVAFFHDAPSGLRAIIAVHDLRLGPALGGCRFWSYASEGDALRDALRLSRGMTYKNALAGLPFGGGKAVILADRARTRTRAMLRAFGRCVESLGGRYVTAEDVGMGVEDIEVVAEETEHVAGLASRTGDPSPMTAYGVFQGIRAAVRHRLGRDSLEDVRVAVQGLGSVGMRLCRLLDDEGAELVVCDLDPAAVAAARADFSARVVAPADIFDQDVDVFAPCALGGVLDDATVPRLRASIVAGAANNQLAEPRHGAALRVRGITYVPDYSINAGGVIDIATGVGGRYDPERSRRRVERIGERVSALLRRADLEGRATSEIADELARERIASAGTRRSCAGSGPGIQSRARAAG